MEDIPGSVLAAEQVPLLVPTDVHSESHPAECSCRKIIFSAADRLALSPKRPTTSSSPSSPSAEPRLKIADIPITCPERLEQAAVTATTTSELTIADRKVDSSSTATTGPPVPKTYLYLAYGSNLAAETFLGRRGIRPISRINVSAPAFDLNFGLGGLPYWEPCFANVEPRRKIPEPPARPPLNPPRPPPFDPSPKPPVNPPPTPSSSSFPSAGDEGVLLPSLPPKDGPTWNKGLYGVVYEVTAEDYATIVKTEGGGASYKDVVTPCIPLPPNAHIPETPPIPELPRPFLAHTLYAPRLPVPPLEHGSDDPDGDKDRCKDRLKKYLGRLLLPLQRPLDYAQPSLRYITLLRDGARENDLPGDYQTYLADLHHYAITSRAQTVGRYLYILVWFPWLVLFMGVLSRLFADRKTGKVPHWLGVMTTVLFNAMWMSYDGVFKKWFGDGERTQVVEGGDGDGAAAGQQKWNVWSGYGRRRRSSFVLPGQGLGAARDEEKDRLLADW